jgi:hypothetical protein
MSEASARDANDIKVETVKADRYGEIEATFDIPKDLRNRDEIAIRLQSADNSGYYVFTIFDN